MNRYEKRVRAFAVCLSALAGYVDAVGFVQSGGFFVSFMSGNSTRLGVGASEAVRDAVIAGGLIVAFLVGVIGGSLLGHFAKTRRVGALLVLIGLLLAVAGLLSGRGLLAAALAATAFAMGAENAIFEREGEVRIGLTYMTGSLVKIGQGIAAMAIGRSSWEWINYLLLWSGFVIGAVSGAAAQSILGLDSLWLPSASALLLAGFSRSIFRPSHAQA